MRFVAVCLALLNVAAFDYDSQSSVFPIERSVYSDNPLSFAEEAGSVSLTKYDFVSVSYARPYGLDSLNASSLSAGLTRECCDFHVSGNYFGSNFYSETKIRAGANLAYKYAGLGISTDILRYGINIDGRKYSKWVNDYNAGLIVRPVSFFRVGLYERGIVSLIDERRELYPSMLSAGISITPFPGAEFIANINFKDNDKIKLFEISFNLAKNVNCSFGYSPDLSLYSASGTFYLNRYRVQYSFRNHSVLGLTHNVSISFVLGEVELHSTVIEISKKHKYQFEENIDIQKAGLDELLSIEGMSVEIAQRIISYRERFGKISKKSLVQIGVEGELLDSILRRAENLAEPESGKHFKKTPLFQPKKSKTDLFNKLVSSGIPHSKALSIADDFMIRGKKYVLNGIERYELEKQMSGRVIDICSNY